jgi:prepilin-type N-terminal cleavage/methylation domain-containing protein
MMTRRRGFTLIELLVVLTIIILVSVVALPTILPALQHREVSEAARILQGALAGARDKAIHDGQPSGIRLVPDPAFLSLQPARLADGTVNPTAGMVDPTQPLAWSRIVPIGPAPDYSEGFCTPILPHTTTYQGATLSSPAYIRSAYGPALMLIENPIDPKSFAPNPPTSWFWNVRVGDKIQLNNSGPWYTVIGPMVIRPDGYNFVAKAKAGGGAANAEQFVNAGPPLPLATLQGFGYVPTLSYPGHGTRPVEFLILVNGQDDNGNGYVDEGFDGVDNNGIMGTDEHMPGVYVVVNGQSVLADEWEQEAWLGSVLTNALDNVPYTIARRPAPSTNAREIALPTSMVVDGTTGFGPAATFERSRLPINPYDGTADIVINPDGTVLPTTLYSSPAPVSMAGAFYHFWLAERQDVATPAGTTLPTLPILRPGGADAGYTGPVLKGEYSLLTLFARSGQVAVNAGAPFDDPLNPYNGSAYDPGFPFREAMRGVSSGP